MFNNCWRKWVYYFFLVHLLVNIISISLSLFEDLGVCDLLFFMWNKLLIWSTFYNVQLHECFGSALVAMGPEILLSLIPLNLEAEDSSDANVWLFPILKHYIVGAPLNYFTEEILTMIKRVREKAQKVLNLLKRCSSIILNHSINFFVHFSAWEARIDGVIKECRCTCLLFVVSAAFFLQLSFRYY